MMDCPWTVPAFEIAVERDVPYSTAKGYWTHAPVGKPWATFKLVFRLVRQRSVTLDMDIYKPTGDGDGKRPLLLMMHGGSFFFGEKDEPGQAGWCRHFASLGYVAVSINYRLGFHACKKSTRQAELHALEDADAALAYLLTREDLRIDPDRIFAAGTSAGAIMALNLAFRREGLRIRAVGNLWGSIHDLSVLGNASSPILSFQSVNDPVMPYDGGYPVKALSLIMPLFIDYMYGTHAIHEKALSIGLKSEHHPCEERRHRLHLDDDMQYTPRFYEIRDAMVKFFAEQME